MRIFKNGKVDEVRIKKFYEEVSFYRNFAVYIKMIGISLSVVNMFYYSVYVFKFKDKKEKLLFVRWKFVFKDGIKYFNF